MDNKNTELSQHITRPTHVGDDNLYYMYTSNGYMLLEDDEWDYVNTIPNLRLLDDISNAIEQRREIKRLHDLIDELKYDLDNANEELNAKIKLLNDRCNESEFKAVDILLGITSDN
jgi:hypothetical protein